MTESNDGDVDKQVEDSEILLVVTAKSSANIRKGPSSKTDIETTAQRDTVLVATGKTETADNGDL